MRRTAYVILRNGLALVVAYALVAISGRIGPALPHDFHLLIGAVFASGFIADNAIARAARRSVSEGARPDE